MAMVWVIPHVQYRGFHKQKIVGDCTGMSQYSLGLLADMRKAETASAANRGTKHESDTESGGRQKKLRN